MLKIYTDSSQKVGTYNMRLTVKFLSNYPYQNTANLDFLVIIDDKSLQNLPILSVESSSVDS